MINYDLTRIKLIAFDIDGVLSRSTISIDETGNPIRTASVKDGFAIHLALKLGFPIAIISAGHSDSVQRRYERLGSLDVHMSCSDKIAMYEQLLQKYNLKDENVLYMGDDIPDIPILKRCGCPCCPNDASPEVRDICIYVSHIDGGMGCGRDVVEQVLKAQGEWLSDPSAYIW